MADTTPQSNEENNQSGAQSQNPPIDQEEIISQAAEKAAILAAERSKVDEDAIVKRAREEAKSEIIEKIAGKPEIDEDAPAWVKRGEKAPKSWDEVLTESEKRAAKKFKKEQEELAKEQQQKASEDAEQKNKTIQEWNKIWDQQLEELESSGKLPKMAEEVKAKLKSGKELTEEEKQDPGIVARFKLQKIALENKESNLKVAYYEHYQSSEEEQNESMTGAPVFGSRKVPTANRGGEFTYEEIRNARNYEDLLEP